MRFILSQIILERALKTIGFGLLLLFYNYLYPQNANHLIEVVGTAMIFIAAGNFPNQNIYAQKIANLRTDDNQFNYFKFNFSLLLSFISFVWSQNIFLTIFIFSSIINVSPHILHSLETNKNTFNKIIFILIVCFLFKLYFFFISSNLDIFFLISAIENIASILIVRKFDLIRKIDIFAFLKKLELKGELNLWILGVLFSLIQNFDSQFTTFDNSNASEYFYFKKIFDFSIVLLGWISFSLPKLFSKNNFDIIYKLNKYKYLFTFLILLFNIIIILLSHILNHYLILVSGVIVICFDTYVLRLEIFRKKTQLILIVYSFRLFCLFIFSYFFTNEIFYFVMYFPLILYISIPVYFLCLKLQK